MSDNENNNNINMQSGVTWTVSGPCYHIAGITCPNCAPRKASACPYCTPRCPHGYPLDTQPWPYQPWIIYSGTVSGSTSGTNITWTTS